MSNREPLTVEKESPPKRTLNVQPITDEKAAESAAAGGELQLLPWDIPEEEFKKFFEDYLKKIDYSQRNSYGDVETCIK